MELNQFSMKNVVNGIICIGWIVIGITVIATGNGVGLVSAFQVSPPILHSATRTASATRLHSLQELAKDISTQVSQIRDSGRQRQEQPCTVFVGGKGGVGKTSVSSALATHLAQNEGLNVLIVSTDPAHSLGDALDVNLRVGRGKPVPVAENLQACEVDATEALAQLQNSLAAFDVNQLADAMGIDPQTLESFGLAEFNSLLSDNAPPGLDEFVALSNVLQRDATDGKIDVIVVDTAPTGHTLRLLALPQFLDGLLGKVIQLRLKLSSFASTISAFFGGDDTQRQRAQTIDAALTNLETFRVRMSYMQSTLQNPLKTKFVVVSIPTRLSVAESKRLVSELSSQHVTVSDIVMNQCIKESDVSAGTSAYYEKRQAGQQHWIQQLQETTAQLSASPQYQSNTRDPQQPESIQITQLPLFDAELVGVPTLSNVGKQAFVDNPNFAHLMSTSSPEERLPKLVVCGGKGGVGKTTTSSSLAISMANQGHRVALISTDPAHSLGDAIDMDLSGGQLIDCPIENNESGGSLSVMEIDPSAALGRLKSVIDDLLGKNKLASSSSYGEEAEGLMGGEMSKTLQDLGDIFETLPAGTDEIVALVQVVNLCKKGGFDRVVLDTAPTGHTLRMLSTPAFLADLIDRVLALAERLTTNPAVQMLLAGAMGGANNNDGGYVDEDDGIGEFEAQIAAAKSTLLNFQLSMYNLEDMLSDPGQTEFLVVTIPTELAVRESVRLLNDLTLNEDAPIRVRNVVVNQVLKESGEDQSIFLNKVQNAQQASIKDLKEVTLSVQPSPRITQVEYLDSEPRGPEGLQRLGKVLMEQEKV